MIIQTKIQEQEVKVLKQTQIWEEGEERKKKERNR